MTREKSKLKSRRPKRLSSRQRALICAAAGVDKKAEDPVILGVGKLTSYADYFVILSGRSITHVQTIAENVIEAIGKTGSRPLGVEGEREARWILIDWGDVIVHVFHYEERQFYELESLWSDARRVRFPPKPRKKDAPRAPVAE